MRKLLIDSNCFFNENYLSSLNLQENELYTTDIVIKALESECRNDIMDFVKNAKSFISEDAIEDQLFITDFLISDQIVKINIIVRNDYNQIFDDSKLLEIAKDYGLTLVTEDRNLKILAISKGIEVKL